MTMRITGHQPSLQRVTPLARSFAGRSGPEGSASRPGHHAGLAPAFRGRVIQLPPVRALSRHETDGLSSDDLRRTSGVAVEHAPVGAWTMPQVHELQHALLQDPVFAAAFSALGPKETSRWVRSLHGAIADATRDSGAPGAAMFMRFPKAYGSVGHLALGSTFRDPDGRLRVCFLHQESLPDIDATGTRRNTATGRFYSTFATAGDHPDGISPVAESIKRGGLPYINAEACACPGDMPQIIEALQRGVGDHVYAPSSTWPGVAEGRKAGKPHAGTCFKTTEAAMSALAGKPLQWQADRDASASFEALAPHICIDLERFRTIKVGARQLPLRQAFDQGLREQMVAFKKLGEGWGEDEPWHVQPGGTVADRLRADMEAIARSLDAQEARVLPPVVRQVRAEIKAINQAIDAQAAKLSVGAPGPDAPPAK